MDEIMSKRMGIQIGKAEPPPQLGERFLEQQRRDEERKHQAEEFER